MQCSAYPKFKLKSAKYKALMLSVNLQMKNCYITFDSGSRKYNIVNGENNSIILSISANATELPQHSDGSPFIVFRKTMLGLEMPTIQEANEFVADFMLQTSTWWRQSDL